MLKYNLKTSVDNMADYLHDLRIRKCLLNKPQTEQTIKGKDGKVKQIKMKNICIIKYQTERNREVQIRRKRQ